MTTFAPTAVRASELARCVRMAALRAHGHTHEDYDEQTRRYFARGHLYTEYVWRQLEAKHGTGTVDREVVIPWPLGEGHADLYVKPEKLLVEVKSTVTPSTSSPMFDMALMQLRLYLHFHTSAERAALYLINPSDLRGEDVFEVRLTPEDVDEIEEAVDLVRGSLNGGALPDRVCVKPSQAVGRLCPFAEACFDGWEPDPPAEVTDPAAVEIASQLAEVKAEERRLNARLRELEPAKAEAQAALADVLPVGESLVGPWKVTRTHVQRSPVFSVKAFEAAGHSVEPLAGFFRPGAEYDTFRVARAEASGEVDYGDEAPF